MLQAERFREWEGTAEVDVDLPCWIPGRTMAGLKDMGEPSLAACIGEHGDVVEFGVIR